MREILPPGLFLIDALLTGATAWPLVCAAGHASRGFLEAIVAWGWTVVAIVAGTGTILGETGGFGAVGFLLAHTFLAIGVLVWRRRMQADDRGAFQRTLRQARAFFARPGMERVLGLGFFLVLAALTAIAAGAEVGSVDALTYHLPRMAHWLQEGRIRVLDAADARLNFVAGLPEIVGAWILGATAEGFRLVILVQAIGGILVVGATIGLARCSGMTRIGALLAGALLLGMANVVVQFTAGQTDLFAAGAFAAAFYLWVSAHQAGKISVPGLLGAGLALGAKGTLFYLAPGALIWVAWFVWRRRLSWSQWRTSFGVALVGVLFFAGPLFWRNWRTYGDALGPREWVRKHHQGFTSVAELGRKLQWNLTASFAQNLAPGSQPRLLQAPARSIGERLARTLPNDDPHTLGGLKRRETVNGLLQDRAPDADTVAFGLVSGSMFFAGVTVAVVTCRRRREDRLILVWAGGVVVFVLFFHGMQQWHPFGFRYLTLAAPWVAIVGAWGLEQCARLWRVLAWSLALLATGDIAWSVTTRTPQAGWRMIVQPESMFDYFLAQRWRQWSQDLDAGGTPLGIALPEERPIAAFYRQGVSRPVTFIPNAGAAAQTAEDLTRDEPGWVIVAATRFIGREGHVATRTWLLAGDETQPGSLAAYRRLRPGETPPPVLYRHVRQIDAGGTRYDLRVKTWDDGHVRFTLVNPASAACDYVIAMGPALRREGRIAAAATAELEVGLPAQQVSEVSVTFRFSPEGKGIGPLPVVYVGAR